MDIQILESNFTQDLGEIEKRVDKLNKDAKEIQKLKKIGTTMASLKLNRRPKNLSMCVKKLKKTTLEGNQAERVLGQVPVPGSSVEVNRPSYPFSNVNTVARPSCQPLA
ncbi:uncharacterized protein LOC124199712 [Daphnia pulex]|uniref:uncharacterized protein LOC124199712 n=1 Tax=Daphnia pulex TaxID=6669 RepID=UPI001EDECE62|nr:uncharacterized protein LOC124199712 [Daphnia pulex]XP_046451588.1 uncharacterized protein LOC124199712 [Daphnia pulex]